VNSKSLTVGHFQAPFINTINDVRFTLSFPFQTKEYSKVIFFGNFFCLKWEQPCIGEEAAIRWIAKHTQWTELKWSKLAMGLFGDLYGSHFESVVSNSYYGMLRGQLHTNLPPEHPIIKKKKTSSVFPSSDRNTSGSLGEREMLWEQEPQASVSTAFSSSPKRSRVFL